MFRDEDPVEEALGVRCEYMTPDDLTNYIRTFHKAFGLKTPEPTYADLQKFIALQGTYGKRGAGRIVKWAFFGGGPYRGKWKDSPITASDFSPGARWWTDRLNLEMQEYIRKEKAPKPEPVYSVRTLDF